MELLTGRCTQAPPAQRLQLEAPALLFSYHLHELLPGRVCVVELPGRVTLAHTACLVPMFTTFRRSHQLARPLCGGWLV